MTATIQNRNIKSNPISFNIKSVNLVDDQTINNIKDIKLDPLNILDRIRNWIEKYWHLILGLLIIAGLLLLIYKKVKTKERNCNNSRAANTSTHYFVRKIKRNRKRKIMATRKAQALFHKD